MEDNFLCQASAILKRVNSSESLQEISSEILSVALHFSGSDYGSFVSVDWENEELNIVATAGHIWGNDRGSMRLRVGEGITGRVAGSGETYNCGDVRIDPVYVNVCDSILSELAIPVEVAGRVWGIVNLDSTRLQHFDRETVIKMELLAEMVASAIDYRLRSEREREMIGSLAEAEKLSAMGQLVAGIAHEINNPLASILGSANLLGEESLPENARESVEVIRKQAKRAGDLVKQMLAFSRMGAATERKTLSLRKVVEEAIDLVQPQVKLTGVNLIAEYSKEEIACSVSATQIQQVIVNLITNAAQACAGIDAAEIRVRIELNEGLALVSIRDNGPGMNAETMERIFDPFFTTKEEGKGTGLGLSISREIAISHQGTLTCSSSTGSGCEFILSIPVSTNSESSGTAEQSRRPSQSDRTHHKPNVLIIDDEAPIRWMLKRLFTPIAGKLTVTESAEEAIRGCETDAFDLVISDFHLPGIDGIELSQQIQKRMSPRFILITGDATSSRIDQKNIGNDVRVLQKPFELDELLNLAFEELGTGEVALAS